MLLRRDQGDLRLPLKWEKSGKRVKHYNKERIKREPLVDANKNSKENCRVSLDNKEFAATTTNRPPLKV